MKIAKYALMTLMLMTAGSVTMLAQDTTPPPAAGPGSMLDMHQNYKYKADTMHGGGPHGRWWSDPNMISELGLSQDQQTKLDNIMQQNRLKLIDLNASLQKEEAILEPLVSADSPDETKITSQIDRVAQARAELEKAHARMLLQVRTVLTPDQWSKLKAMHGGNMGMGMHGMGGMHGKAPAPPSPPPPPQ
jgi:protein CpxP